MHKWLAIFCLCCLVMVGCTSVKTANPDPGLEVVAVPSWYPTIENDAKYFYAVGSSGVSSYSEARTAAEAEGKSLIEEYFSTHPLKAMQNVVNSIFFPSAMEMDIGLLQDTFRSASHVLVKGSEILDEWRAPDGKLYVLVGLPLSVLKENLENVL